MKKLVAILGGGESGVGAAILAQKQGFSVFLSDLGKIKEKYKQVLADYNIEFEEEKHSTERKFFRLAELVIKSPGIPEKAPLIVQLKEQKTPVISEIEFAGRYTSAKTICIAGK